MALALGFVAETVPGGWFAPEAAGGWFDSEIVNLGGGGGGTTFAGESVAQSTAQAGGASGLAAKGQSVAQSWAVGVGVLTIAGAGESVGQSTGQAVPLVPVVVSGAGTSVGQSWSVAPGALAVNAQASGVAQSTAKGSPAAGVAATAQPVAQSLTQARGALGAASVGESIGQSTAQGRASLVLAAKANSVAVSVMQGVGLANTPSGTFGQSVGQSWAQAVGMVTVGVAGQSISISYASAVGELVPVPPPLVNPPVGVSPRVDIDICNEALSTIGIGTEIHDLISESSAEAQACRRFFYRVRDLILRDFPWPRAKAVDVLELVASDPCGQWKYSYRLPVEAVSIIRVENYLTPKLDTWGSRIPYELGRDDTGVLLFTDALSASAKYVYDETDLTRWPADMLEVLVYLLASKIAPRFGPESVKLGLLAFQRYAQRLGIAQAQALNEEAPARPVQSDYQRARRSVLV